MHLIVRASVYGLESMLKTVILVVIAIRPAISDACGNAVAWTTNDYVAVLLKAEKRLDAGQPGDALRALRDVKFTGDRAQRAQLQQRTKDVRALIQLRMANDLEAVVTHFKARTEQNPKSVHHRAWLAEAYVAAGNVELARAILDDLVKRDVMPDAHAYLALAKITRGPDRLAAWKACRVRARVKAICELPATHARR
jgi:pentatricopeptide repeat protein